MKIISDYIHESRKKFTIFEISIVIERLFIFTGPVFFPATNELCANWTIEKQMFLPKLPSPLH